MGRLVVKEFVSNAFSNEQALILKEQIKNNLVESEKLILDFQGISQYTTLFFNFSTGYFIKKMGKESYDNQFELQNLSELGVSTYTHSYNNSLRDVKDDEKISNAIQSILTDIGDV